MQCPLRVMVDARMLVGRFSGVARFVTRLVDALTDQDGIEVVALCGRRLYPPWDGRADIEVVTSSFDRGDRTACRRVLWEETVLPRVIRRAGVDVFHATWNSGVPAFCPVPAVLTIHDLIPWTDPGAHFATVRQRLCHRYAMRASARRACRVTTVSEYVRRQVIDTLRVPPERVVTVPNGVRLSGVGPTFHPVGPTFQSVERQTSSVAPLWATWSATEHQRPPQGAAATVPHVPPFALYVGGHTPRKNVAAVFAAVRRYWERYDPSLELRLTGDARSLVGNAAEAYRSLLGDARVRFLGDVDDGELERQYASAQVLLMLSREEGFGLPVLEAMAHGCPVVGAERTALPEVMGDAGLLVDPDNNDEVVEAMRRVLTEPDLRAELARRGLARAQTFGWDVTATRMREAYERVRRKPRRLLQAQ